LTTYEAVFILDSKKAEDGGEAFSRDVAGHIKGLGGNVREKTLLGRKSLARPIGKHRAGTYWYFLMDMEPASVAPFEDKYRLNSLVLRLKYFKIDEEELVARAARPAERFGPDGMGDDDGPGRRYER